jgi:hypothetical protein
LFEYSQVLGRLGRAEANLVRHARDDLLHKGWSIRRTSTVRFAAIAKQPRCWFIALIWCSL